MSVTLIVKAPNQQIEDQTIQCELSWTIKRLKGYLSEVYPSKPVSFLTTVIASSLLNIKNYCMASGKFVNILYFLSPAH